MDWHRLRPWHTTQAKSFEELCYQVAKTLFGDQGTFTSIDDSGGGDGVEFYLTFPDGTQWGWQAKFYLPDSRLDNSRRTKVKESLKRALERHPRLTKWYLCTPMTFTPDEQLWFDGADRNTSGRRLVSLPTVVPADRTVELLHWTESDFGNWLTQPRFAGKRHYFFGELELDLDWFQEQLDRQRPQVSQEYTPGLHVTTNTDGVFSTYLADSSALTQLDTLLLQLDNACADVPRRAARHPLLSPPALAVWMGQAEDLRTKLRAVATALQTGDFRISAAIDTDGPLLAFDHATAALREVVTTQAQAINAVEFEDPFDEQDAFRNRAAFLEAVATANDRAGALRGYFSWSRSPELHLHADAGQGKTHAVFDACHRRLEDRRPALFVSARGLRDSHPVSVQLHDRFGLPPAYGWPDFLDALESAAEAHRTRLPVVIDGLNEAGPIGQDNRWTYDLRSLVADFRARPALLLVTTCRTSYLDAIWPDQSHGVPQHFHVVRGFEMRTLEATAAYFQHYRLTADLSHAPLRQFAHPIYLRIFCEAHNPEREETRPVYFGEEALYSVFDRFLQRVSRRVAARVSAWPGQDVVRPILDQLAERLWATGARDVPFDAFMFMSDSSTGVPWESSKAEALLSEGLVANRDFVLGEERVGFTYDLLGGYLIARWLLRQHANDVPGFLRTPGARRALLGEGGDAHPLAEDIGRCLAALCAMELGALMHALASVAAYERFALPMVFELPPGRISDRERTLVAGALRDAGKARQTLEWARPVLFAPHHPLNARFVSGILTPMGVTQRDLTWSEVVRGTEVMFLDVVDRLEQGARTGMDGALERLDLLAEFSAWLLTTPAREVRDLATRALHWHALARPAAFQDIFHRLMRVNDPYVVERLLAAALGAAFASRTRPDGDALVREHLPSLARVAFDVMFALGASHPTTHVLTRDYGRRLIKEAQARYPDLFSPADLERVQGAYPPDLRRSWGEAEDRDAGQYRSGNDPLGSDFRNYTLGRLVPGRRNYDFHHPDYLTVVAKVRWRIYALGYRLDDFGDIDTLIARSTMPRRMDDGRKTERYGKKYAWIAYLELAGAMMDDGAIEGEIEDFVDLDPSFPTTPRQHQLVTDDWLDRHERDTDAWIAQGGPPYVHPLLVRADLLDQAGPWVLLDGYVTHSDDVLGRERFTFLRSFFVPDATFEAFLARFSTQDFGARWLPEKPEVHDRYAADLPLTFDTTETQEMEFDAGLKDNQADREVNELTIDLVANNEVIQTVTFAVSGAGESFPYEPTVQDASWSGNKSVANLGWDVTVPTRALVEELRMRRGAEDFDFEGPDGHVLSLYLEHEGDSDERESFVYMRADALGAYLTRRRMRLVWGVWGERLRPAASQTIPLEDRQESSSPSYRVFQQVFVWDPSGEGRLVDAATVKPL